MSRFFTFVLLLFIVVSSIGATSLQVAEPVPIRDFSSRTGRIVNGEDAKEGQFPWQVAIFGSSDEYPSYLCSGALISDQWVITAGHCVYGATKATIYSGSVNMSSPNRTASQGSEFIVFQYYNSTYLNHDIGLIKLSEPVALNDNIKPIALPETEVQADTSVTVSGWSSVTDDDPNPYTQILQYITVTTIENLRCEAVYGYLRVLSDTLCTVGGDPVKSPCLGDSGGPVVINIDTDPVLVATFSFVNAYGCEESYPAGNIRSMYYREWIKEQTGI